MDEIRKSKDHISGAKHLNVRLYAQLQYIRDVKIKQTKTPRR